MYFQGVASIIQMYYKLPSQNAIIDNYNLKAFQGTLSNYWIFIYSFYIFYLVSAMCGSPLLQNINGKISKEFIIIIQNCMNQNQSDFFAQPEQWPQVIFHRTSTVEIREPVQPVEVIPDATPPPSQDDEPQSSIELDRVDLFRMNIMRYAYSRAHHYFFDLAKFQRDPGSFSYAHDPSNCFKYIFSKDQITYRGSKLKDIINRQYFTLPVREIDTRPSRAKNPLHHALFQTQDKKITMDRLIVTYRQILNNIENLALSGKINSFICLHRDPKVKQVLNSCTTVSEKRQTLINRLQELLQNKRISERQWYAQDNINMAPSRNQRYHQSIRTKLQFFDKSRIVTSLYSNLFYMKELIKTPFEDKLTQFMQRVFTFYMEEENCINEKTIEDLVLNYKQNLVQAYNECPRVIFPTHVLSLNPKIFKIANQILGKRLSSRSIQQYTILNELCKKLFKTELMVQAQYQVDDEYIFRLEASRNLTRIRAFKKSPSKEQPIINRSYQMLDDEINCQGLCFESHQQQQVFIIKRNQSIELTSPQYLILMNWHWMYLIVQQMYPYIIKNPQFIDILASPHYSLINQSVGQAFHSPLIGTFKYCLEELAYNLTAQRYLNFEKFRLEFEFKEDKNAVLLWRVQNHEEEQQMKERQEQAVDYDILYFGKRVKSLQNQWV